MAKYFSCIFSFFALILLLQSSALTAQNSGNISVGQFLTATTNGPAWLSPSGDFAFGFHELNTTTNLFLLSIWYAKIPDTIVWYANEGHPFPQGSKVTLTAQQGLVVTNPQGTHVWNTSDLNGTTAIGYGLMDDIGEFSIKSNRNNATVWGSFEHPTDTLLPGQILEEERMVYSRLSETNFTKGRFLLSIQDGNFVLYAREPASNFTIGAYYKSDTSKAANQTNAGDRLVYEESGNMYISKTNGSKIYLTPDKIVSARDYYHRATLDFDGVLTWYYHPRSFTDKTNVAWSNTKSIPDNICGSFGADIDAGACGYNNICTLGADRRPKCECPSNYSLTDTNDMYGSCKPDFTLHACDDNGQGFLTDKYKLLELRNTDWPYYDNYYARLSSEEDCKSFCLNDCLCAAVVFDGTACWKKKMPPSHGRQGSGERRTTWLKVGNDLISDQQISPPKKVKNKLNAVIAALLGGSVFIIFFSLSANCLGVLFIYRKKRFRWLDGRQSRTLTEFSNITCYSYQELKEATDSFKEELGRGAFGVVYKGMIAAGDRRFVVAVKMLDRISKDADKEFQTEVNAIGQTHHKNLVRLVGFCKEEDQRLLVYEYMSNGTIADYLFDDLKPSWVARNQVAQEIARGLSYLHEECSTQIIHCDIKPQNILLDDCHNARISDFGLAKLLVLNQTQTYTAIRGTKGYVAPEWFRNKPVTVKLDVYSFGVLLLEIICCRKNVCSDISAEEPTILTDWAFDCYQSGTLDSLLNDDMEALNDRQRFERFVMVALWCIQEDPSLRPTMRLVTLMLEGLAEVAMPPCASSFSISTQC